MHSHDRTLLSRLGFADQDKGEPRHEWACQYLARPAVSLRLVERLMASPSLRNFAVTLCRPEFPISKGAGQYKVSIGFVDLLLQVTAEQLVTRTRHVEVTEPPSDRVLEQYENSLLEYELQLAAYQRSQCIPGASYRPQPYLPRKPLGRTYEKAVQEQRWERHFGGRDSDNLPVVVIEVKIGFTPASEIVRQLGLYREHLPVTRHSRWLAVTAFAVSAADLETFRLARVDHFKLGPEFESYCEERRRDAEKPPCNEEI